MATKKKAPPDPAPIAAAAAPSAMERFFAALPQAIKLTQAIHPLAPGPSKTNTALSIAALIAGLTGALVPAGNVQVATQIIGLTVTALQQSGEMTKDQV